MPTTSLKNVPPVHPPPALALPAVRVICLAVLPLPGGAYRITFEKTLKGRPRESLHQIGSLRFTLETRDSRHGFTPGERTTLRAVLETQAVSADR